MIPIGIRNAASEWLKDGWEVKQSSIGNVFVITWPNEDGPDITPPIYTIEDDEVTTIRPLSGEWFDMVEVLYNKQISNR